MDTNANFSAICDHPKGSRDSPRDFKFAKLTTNSFALNGIFFSAKENGTVKQNNQSDVKAFIKLTKHIAEK